MVPFGVGLKGRLARLLDRRCRTLFRMGGHGGTRSQHDEKANREPKRDKQKETISAHERVVYCFVVKARSIRSQNSSAS